MKNYDIVILGGGIHGVCIAELAAANGLSVLLIEKKGLASGTSSKSSKLIHGGLRYLETAQFNLVKECLQEREKLRQRAPSLVKLKPFIIPMYRSSNRKPVTIRVGLSLYAVLGGGGEHVRYSSIKSSEWSSLDGLITKDLRHVFRYFDAQTDDQLLTKAVMASAQKLGADLMMPMTFSHAEKKADQWQITVIEAASPVHIQAKVIINATGPWINQTLAKIETDLCHVPIEWVQGTHIIVDDTIEKGIYYVEAPTDKRAVFVMPWKGKTLIGTTETLFKNDPDQVKPLDQEKDYLLQTYLHYFPGKSAMIVDAFAGLRVLPAAENAPFQRSRETILWQDDNSMPKLINVYGGKLTSAQATATKVMAKLKNMFTIDAELDLSKRLLT